MMSPEQARKLVASAERYADDDKRAVLAENIDAGELVDALLTVASMRYEYAVQVLLSDGAGGNVWHFADEDSLPFGSLKPYEVRWYTKKEAQEILDAEVDCFGHEEDIRIVRRLAGESEVVE